jgi:exosome complex component CSL4
MSSSSSERKTGKIVSPGERLGVIEEFSSDAGTYVRDGVIHSKVVGRALIDLKNKRVSVYQLVHGESVPKVGSVVLGQVSGVQSDNASIRIFKIGDRTVSGFFSGVLHVSDVQIQYVESMFDICKPSDIIRARIISEKNQVYHLSTQDKNLGVVYAFCSQCGYSLESKRQALHCSRCGKIEKRKIALDYGKGAL